MPLLPDSQCYLNGEFCDLREARVSVLDRGFLQGDGVSEIVPVFGRRLFRFADHLVRLNASLHKMRIANPLDEDKWLAHCRRVVMAQGHADQLVHVQVTRGVALPEARLPLQTAPTVLIMSRPLVHPSPEQRHVGVSCVTARDFRWERGDIDTISRQGDVLAYQTAIDRGVHDALLFRGGHLTEASTGPVWVVREGAVLGALPGDHVHESVQLALIRELCEELGLAFNLRGLTEAEVLSADEVMLGTASHELLPVTLIDGQAVGHGPLRGKPGPVHARLSAACQSAWTAQSI